jgi:hypothetical protein
LVKNREEFVPGRPKAIGDELWLKQLEVPTKQIATRWTFERGSHL